MLAAGSEIDTANLGEGQATERNEVDLTEALERFERNKAIVQDKCQSKDWKLRELGLNAMLECFESTPASILRDNLEFLQSCTIILKTCLEDANSQIYLAGV